MKNTCVFLKVLLITSLFLIIPLNSTNAQKVIGITLKSKTLMEEKDGFKWYVYSYEYHLKYRGRDIYFTRESAYDTNERLLIDNKFMIDWLKKSRKLKKEWKKDLSKLDVYNIKVNYDPEYSVFISSHNDGSAVYDRNGRQILWGDKILFEGHGVINTETTRWRSFSRMGNELWSDVAHGCVVKNGKVIISSKEDNHVFAGGLYLTEPNEYRGCNVYDENGKKFYYIHGGFDRYNYNTDNFRLEINTEQANNGDYWVIVTRHWVFDKYSRNNPTDNFLINSRTKKIIPCDYNSYKFLDGCDYIQIGGWENTMENKKFVVTYYQIGLADKDGNIIIAPEKKFEKRIEEINYLVSNGDKCFFSIRSADCTQLIMCENGRKKNICNLSYNDVINVEKARQGFYLMAYAFDDVGDIVVNNNGEIIIPDSRSYSDISYNKEKNHFEARYTRGYKEYKVVCDLNGNEISKELFRETLPSRSTSSSTSSSSQHSTTNNSTNKSSNQDNNQTQTIKIERDPIPVQVWVPCVCQGGKCGVCDGLGCNKFAYMNNRMEPCMGCGWSGKCQWCGGQGGHYEVQYK